MKYMVCAGDQDFRDQCNSTIDEINALPAVVNKNIQVEMIDIDDTRNKQVNAIIVDGKQHSKDDANGILTTIKRRRFIDFVLLYAKACNIVVLFEEYLMDCYSNEKWLDTESYNVTINGMYISNPLGEPRYKHNLQNYLIFVESRNKNDYPTYAIKQMCRCMGARIVKYCLNSIFAQG